MPKDLTRVKTKVAFNLTKRQMICFGTGGLLGIPLFFLLRGPMGPSPAAMCMVLVMLPFFLVGVYEKNGQPMEKVLGNIVQSCFLRPRKRPYRTNNFYAVLERQDRLEKEVHRIVQGHQKLVPPPVPAGKARAGAGRDSAQQTADPR